jgi:hypothetical protein
MRHAASEALYAYWNEVRGDRIAPERLEIQPARIGSMLLDTFILERIGSRKFRFRLTGTRVSQRFGMDLRSMDFLERWSPADRSLLEHHLQAITDRGCACVFTAAAQTASSQRTALPFEILILPLVHSSNAIDRLLCTIVPLEDAGVNTRLTSLKLLAAEPFWPDGTPRDGGRLFGDRVSNEIPSLATHVRSARIVRRGRRQFRVYDGGRSQSADMKV